MKKASLLLSVLLLAGGCASSKDPSKGSSMNFGKRVTRYFIDAGAAAREGSAIEIPDDKRPKEQWDYFLKKDGAWRLYHADGSTDSFASFSFGDQARKEFDKGATFHWRPGFGQVARDRIKQHQESLPHMVIDATVHQASLDGRISGTEVEGFITAIEQLNPSHVSQREFSTGWSPIAIYDFLEGTRFVQTPEVKRVVSEIDAYAQKRANEMGNSDLGPYAIFPEKIATYLHGLRVLLDEQANQGTDELFSTGKGNIITGRLGNSNTHRVNYRGGKSFGEGHFSTPLPEYLANAPEELTDLMRSFGTGRGMSIGQDLSCTLHHDPHRSVEYVIRRGRPWELTVSSGQTVIIDRKSIKVYEGN